MPDDELPPVGLGTWQNTDPEECAESVATAIDVGYRHVDTAEFYENEAQVGDGLARADADREELFVATKVHPEGTGVEHEQVIEAAEASRERLGVEYLDLLYVHWPVGDYDAAETMPAFDELVDRGTIRHVGVSNFSTDLLDEARDVLDAPIFAHQVEMHPLLPQEELVAYAQERDHHLVAYSPLARGKVFDLDPVQAVARKHGVSEAQVALAWAISKENVVTIPKATGETHIRDNWAARTLELDDEDLARIDGIEREERLIERDGAPWQSE